jgi:hypothetical protein
MNELIKNRLSNTKINWENHPFPYAIIDNFLPDEVFKKITDGLQDVNKFQDLKKKFSSHVELNKKVYGDSDLNEVLKMPINILGGSLVKNYIEKYFEGEKLISLCDWPDYAGYFPFHSMTNGGILGSHVDHSHSKNGDIHIGNAIFYVSPKWENSWGGETLLFDSSGFKILKSIEPAPNRLILFIHSATSFHGVNKVSSPNEINRSTYYMDYYVKENSLSKINQVLKKKCEKKPVYSFHSTSFVPFFPLGFKSFKIKSLFMKNTYPYLKTFLKYLISRFLLSYKFSKFVKEKSSA